MLSWEKQKIILLNSETQNSKLANLYIIQFLCFNFDPDDLFTECIL